MPLNLFYTMVQKSQKWPKPQIKGGPALNMLCTKSTFPSTQQPRTSACFAEIHI